MNIEDDLVIIKNEVKKLLAENETLKQQLEVAVECLEIYALDGQILGCLHARKALGNIKALGGQE